MKIDMSCWIWLTLCLLCTRVCGSRRPNILYIMVDDMGWNDVSYHGSDQILTPNLDTLASQSVVLQHYYSEAICTPARTALLTGKYPMRLGMHGMPLYNSEDRGIPITERLLPAYLKDLGYSTHLVGKWHVGMSRRQYLPLSRGYDTHLGMRGGFLDSYTHDKVEAWPNGRQFFGLDLFDNDIPQDEEDRYIIDVLTERAINFPENRMVGRTEGPGNLVLRHSNPIGTLLYQFPVNSGVIHRHNDSNPFFLHLAHTAPHAGNEGGLLQPPLNTTVKNRHIAHSDRRLYAEIISYLDDSIGKLIRALADKGILQNTLIVFVSDNGAPTVGQFNNWGVNLPFRGKKQTPWEGAVRVPAFIWHPTLKPKVWQGLMHITDWMPTLLGAVGGEIKAEIDGVNQWDSISLNRESQRKEVLIAIEDSSANMYGAYRSGDYKVIIGNVSGLSNGYYGAEFMRNKGPLPDYFPALRNSIVAKVFERYGFTLDYDQVLSMRKATVIKQLDRVRDLTRCEPTLSRGCLYNVRQDPSESHDLWSRGPKVAALLISRLQALWAMQMRRGPTPLDARADPANFEYRWVPWLNDTDPVVNNTSNSDPSLNAINFEAVELNRVRNTSSPNIPKDDTVRSCESTYGFRNLLCILRSVF